MSQYLFELGDEELDGDEAEGATPGDAEEPTDDEDLEVNEGGTMGGGGDASNRGTMGGGGDASSRGTMGGGGDGSI